MNLFSVRPDGIYRIHTRSNIGRDYTRYHPDYGRNHQPEKNIRLAQREIKFQRAGCGKTQRQNQKQSCRAANEAQNNRLGKKLQQDKIIFRAKRFLNADYARSLFHRNKHDVGDAEAAN